MTTDLIFYTQIASLVAFFVALFGLYRALVSQKDATIELLREWIAQLERRSPDTLFDSVAERYGLALEEIERRDVDEAERKGLQARASEEVQRAVREVLARIDAIARRRASARSQERVTPGHGTPRREEGAARRESPAATGSAADAADRSGY